MKVLWRRIPHTPAWVVVWGTLLVLPTLGAGLVMDDVLVRMKLLGAETAWGPSPWWDLYTFAREDLNAALREAGFHPWWSDLGVRMTFFRPLSALTHVLDYALWPHQPVLHHLHSVLWYAGALAAAAAVLRRVHPDAPPVAALAGLLFAASAAHPTMVAWVAARNTIITFILGCAMIALHQRGGRSRLAAAGLLPVGLLAGEAMLGALGYLLAWQLFMAPGPLLRRLGALAPHGLIVVAWRALYTRAGFGAAESAIYHDPGTDLVDFAVSSAINLPVLLMSRWALVPLDAWAIQPDTLNMAFFGLACVVLPVLAWLLWPVLREHARARFWAAGMVASLAPFTATMPMDRLLFFGSLGAAALLSMAVHAMPNRRAVGALLILHLPVSAAFALVRGATTGLGTGMFTDGYMQAPRGEAVPDQTFVYVTSTFHRTHNTLIMRQTRGEPDVPRRVVVLSSLVTDATVRRVDEDTLEVTAAEGFMARDLDRIHRRDVTGFAVGDIVPLPDLDVEIVALTPDGRPETAAFHFRVPLEDPSLRWLVMDATDSPAFPPRPSTADFALPAIGESVVVRSPLSPGQ